MQNLPARLLHSLQHLDHFDAAAFTAVHSEAHRLTSVRINPFKRTGLDLRIEGTVPWNPDGFYLEERPSFTLDPLFQAGCYYPQEAGSMFLHFALAHSLDLAAPLKLLDVCAAPGGKSTLINSLINPESLLVANEIIKSRADILVQNLSKWGTSNTIVTNNDPQKFSELHAFFDAVVIDAPCSGSGLFRKQPEAMLEWSEEHVKACSLRQQRILEDVLPALKENGILVYSTCSYSVDENEAIVKHLVEEKGMEYVPLPVDPAWGIVETPYGYRFYPHLTRSEGFFCAVLRQKQAALPAYLKKKTLTEATRQEKEIIGSFISPGEHCILKKNEQFHLLNPEAERFLSVFEKHFYFKKAGVTLGEIKGKDMVPNQELAWFTGAGNGIRRVEVNKEDALKFLRKENFKPEENITGLVLICYRGFGLGWAKILPNRINNYLPNELRILK